MKKNVNNNLWERKGFFCVMRYRSVENAGKYLIKKHDMKGKNKTFDRFLSSGSRLEKYWRKQKITSNSKKMTITR